MADLTPEYKRELDDAFMDALLESAYHDDREHVEKNIAVVRQRIHKVSGSVKAAQNAWRVLFPMSLAASILIAIIIFSSGGIGESNAYATVTRSMVANKSPRQYRVLMRHQFPRWEDREIEATLYLDGSDRFVMHHPGWRRRGALWIGGDSEERWVVPENGPAAIGPQRTVGQWLVDNDMPDPYLRLSHLLDNLRRNYKLEQQADESIATVRDPDATIVCEHVLGTLKRSRKQMPHTIELWADHTTGIAQRIEIRWDREPSERGPKQWVIELVGSPTLVENWFTIDGHLPAGRKVIRPQDRQQIDQIETLTTP